MDEGWVGEVLGAVGGLDREGTGIGMYNHIVLKLKKNSTEALVSANLHILFPFIV